MTNKTKLLAFFATALLGAFATRYTTFNKNRRSYMDLMMSDTHFICRDCNHWFDQSERANGEVNICTACGETE
jgi:hypothetical protein